MFPVLSSWLLWACNPPLAFFFSVTLPAFVPSSRVPRLGERRHRSGTSQAIFLRSCAAGLLSSTIFFFFHSNPASSCTFKVSSASSAEDAWASADASLASYSRQRNGPTLVLSQGLVHGQVRCWVSGVDVDGVGGGGHGGGGHGGCGRGSRSWWCWLLLLCVVLFLCVRVRVIAVAVVIASLAGTCAWGRYGILLSSFDGLPLVPECRCLASVVVVVVVVAVLCFFFPLTILPCVRVRF